MSKFKPELMYNLSDGMKLSSEQIESMYKELLNMIEDSKKDWNDELSVRFFEEFNTNISYLKKFAEIVPEKAKRLRQTAEELENILQGE